MRDGSINLCTTQKSIVKLLIQMVQINPIKKLEEGNMRLRPLKYRRDKIAG